MVQGPWFEAAIKFCVLRLFTSAMAPQEVNGFLVENLAHISDFRRVDVCTPF